MQPHEYVLVPILVIAWLLAGALLLLLIDDALMAELDQRRRRIAAALLLAAMSIRFAKFDAARTGMGFFRLR